jgi:hypothetical protein
LLYGPKFTNTIVYPIPIGETGYKSELEWLALLRRHEIGYVYIDNWRRYNRIGGAYSAIPPVMSSHPENLWAEAHPDAFKAVAVQSENVRNPRQHRLIAVAYKVDQGELQNLLSRFSSRPAARGDSISNISSWPQ